MDIMKTKTKYIALAATVSLLAGCGGGGGDDAPTAPTYAEMEAAATTAAAGIVDLDTGEVLATERQFLPTTGTATYTGYVGGDVAGDTLIGELSLTANFTGGGTVEGTATNFQHEVDGAYTGTLTMPATNIVANGSGDQEFASTLSGTLANGGSDYTTDIALTGNFVGGTDNTTVVPTAVAGSAIGTVGSDFLQGAFIATQ
jgi:predicted small lipoprotein YifL